MKNLFYSFLNLYILLNFHVAFSVVALFFIFNDFYPKNYIGFLFWSTVFSYGWIRLLNINSNRKLFKTYFYRYRFLFILVFGISFFGAIFYFFKLNNLTKLLIIPLSLITLFYQSIFRRNGIVKILLVSLVWAFLVTMLPLTSLSELNTNRFLKFIFVFIYILMLTLSFDQRDILIDDIRLNTFPQSFPKYKPLIYFLLILFFYFINQYVFDFPNQLITANFMVLLSVILCYFSTEKRNFYYTAFWIEALPIFWWVISFFINFAF